MENALGNGEEGVGGRRIVKRYSNRKLYDTRDSRYVTLLQIADMIRAGEGVEIIDNATKEDKTDVTLALILSEELKACPHAIPVATLEYLIRTPPPSDGLAAWTPGDLLAAVAEASGGTPDLWARALDARIAAVVPTLPSVLELKAALASLNERLAALEARTVQRAGIEPSRPPEE